MTLNDPLANTMSHILNCDKLGKDECIIRPASKIIKEVLNVIKSKGYIGEYEVIDEARGGVIKISLLGNINKCGVVKPRFSLTKNNYETFEQRYLPAKDFGILIVTTSKGIMVHSEALENGDGGKLLAYIY
jgi:small subunit ribosomal protein S8